MNFGQMIVAQKAPAPLSRAVSGISGPKPRAALWRYSATPPESFGLVRISSLPGFENDATGIYEAPQYGVFASLAGYAYWVPITSVDGGPLPAAGLITDLTQYAKSAEGMIEVTKDEVTSILKLNLTTPESRAQWYRAKVKVLAETMEELRDKNYRIAAALAGLQLSTGFSQGDLNTALASIKKIVQGMQFIVDQAASWTVEAGQQQAYADAMTLARRVGSNGRRIQDALLALGAKTIDALEKAADAAGRTANTLKGLQSWGVIAAIGGFALLAMTMKSR